VSLGASPQETDRRANQALKARLNLAHSESRFQRALFRCHEILGRCPRLSLTMLRLRRA